jgi:hypothetical protein
MSTAVEFGSKSAADAVREEHPEAICSQDDARRKTVTFSSDATGAFLEDAQRRADQSRADRESGPGQLELTDHERDRLDFSEGRADVLHARSVEAVSPLTSERFYQAHSRPREPAFISHSSIAQVIYKRTSPRWTVGRPTECAQSSALAAVPAAGTSISPRSSSASTSRAAVTRLFIFS